MKLYQSMDYKLITISLWVAMTIALTTPPAFAEESSGVIIKEIVEEVDQDMAYLEDRIEGFNAKSEELGKELRILKTKSDKLRGAGDLMAKEKANADMISICAKLNDQDISLSNSGRQYRISAQCRQEGLPGDRAWGSSVCRLNVWISRQPKSA